MTRPRVVLSSLSAAMDGGFSAIADVTGALAAVGAETDYRLIGGITVMLHIQRLSLDLPLRSTGDADIGVPPDLSREPELVRHIEALGYARCSETDGNDRSTSGGSQLWISSYPLTRHARDTRFKSATS